MTPAPRGPVVIDTDVYGAEVVPGSMLASRYQPILLGRPALISFQTAAELRYGAIRRGSGDRLGCSDWSRRIAAAETVHTGPELILVCARLRADCERIGHALAQREHNADRWIAATALRLGLPVVSNDGIFAGVPGLDLETAPSLI